MTATNQFYITLPSNSILPNEEGEKKSQSLNNFRVQLPVKMQLYGEWELSLVEMMYPFSWNNVSSDDCTFSVLYRAKNKDDNTDIEGINIPFIVTGQLPKNQYNTFEALTEALNWSFMDELEDFRDDVVTENMKKNLSVRFVYNKSTRRIEIRADYPVAVDKISVSEKLGYMLGFQNQPEPFRQMGNNGQPYYKSVIHAEFPPDIRAGFNVLMVYCNLCPHVIVGHQMAQLLRVVSISGSPDEVVCKTFDTPHYLPLAKREFDSIEIRICDDTGEPVHFNYGKIFIKLHFRKIKMIYV